MKKKTVTKKMVLNKETIAHLDEQEMMVVHGGELATIPPSHCTCTQAVCKDTITDGTVDNC